MAKKQSKTKKGSKKRVSRRNKIQKGGNQQLIDAIKDNTKTPEQLFNDVRGLLLTDESIDLEYKSKQGRTPLYVASSLGYIDVVKALLEKGSNVNTQDKNGMSPIHSAAYNGDADIIDVLIAAPGISVNKTTNDGRTPLHFAANYNKLDAVKALLKHPAISVNDEGPDIDSPIHAALYHNNWDIVLALIEHPKINLEIKCSIGGTPLGIAAKKGNLDVVKALLEKGAKVDNLSTRKTPLYIASKEGHTDVVRVLLNGGANYNLVTSLDETPLYIASKEGHTDVVRVLLDAAQGTDYVNKPDNSGKTPLHAASENGHTDVVTELVCAGAQVNLADKRDNTPLLYASHSGHINVVKKLLSHPFIRVSSGIGLGGKATTRRDGENALSVAAAKKHFDIVELLMPKFLLERPYYGRIQAKNDGVEKQWQIAVERRGVAEVVVKGRSYSPHYVASETEIFVNEDQGKSKQLPLGFGCRTRHDGTRMPGEIAKFIGGKRKTKKSKAKKGSKKRSSRRNKTQSGGSQELINAVMRNDMDSIYNFLNTPGVDVNYTNNNGVTPLIFASWRGNLNIVRLLLDYGAVVQTPNSNVNVLNEAAKYGHIDVVNELLDRGANPGWVDMFGTGIVERVKNNPEMVDLLIRKGIPRYTRHHAERDGVLAQYDQIYLELRALSTVIRDTTNLPLNFGNREGPIGSYFGRFRRFGGKRKTKKSKAKKGSKKRVSRRNKIQEGGDDETEDEMLARVQKIYDEDRDINELNKADRKGKTPLHYASEKGYSSVVEDLTQYTAVEINKIRKKTGKTALHYASENGHGKVVQILLNEVDIDVNIQDKKGKTALHYASENGHGKVVQILLLTDDIDINVNIADELGKTPLHYAYDEGDKDAIEVLRIAGAKEDVVDIAGNVPVYYSLIDHNKVIKNILSHGDAINAPLHNENTALVHSHVKK